jgi:signal transduction histidine kinase
MDFSRQPLQGSDIAAFVFAALALLFVVLWRRDRERGMGWLAIAYALLAVQYAINDVTLPTDARVNPVATTVLAIGGAALNCGLMYYLASPLYPKRWQLAVAVLPPLLPALCVLFTITLYRPWSFLPYAISLCMVIEAALEAARREPRAGHGWLALGMLAVPITLAVTIGWSSDSFYVRYYVLPPAIFFGLMLLTVSLLRRSKALEDENMRRTQAEQALTAVNASLEATVASRTADLQNIVAGLESFNRSISHDLQGSLGGMAGLARVAQDAVQPYGGDLTVARRVLPLIVAEAERSTELVGTLLTLARVSDQHVRKTTVDMNALTQEVIASMAQVKPNAAMPRFIVSELPTVHADINLLRPALTNLIGNAVKFCGYRPQGCVDVLGRVDALTGETIIQVRDNGIGFCGETATGLFQPFTRLHGDDFAGHGVGLSIVRRAIERQGGRVWAESKSGSGASFFFSLPANLNAAPNATTSASSIPASGADSAVPRTTHVHRNDELPHRVAVRA